MKRMGSLKYFSKSLVSLERALWTQGSFEHVCMVSLLLTYCHETVSVGQHFQWMVFVSILMQVCHRFAQQWRITIFISAAMCVVYSQVLTQLDVSRQAKWWQMCAAVLQCSDNMCEFWRSSVLRELLIGLSCKLLIFVYNKTMLSRNLTKHSVTVTTCLSVLMPVKWVHTFETCGELILGKETKCKHSHDHYY
jgi:hypothetical protein